MKVFFDTNVYVAEALSRGVSRRLVQATVAASWRIQTSEYVAEELHRVLTQQLGFSTQLAAAARRRCLRRGRVMRDSASRHYVPDDPKDSPILRAAIEGGADFLVTNDRHLLQLDPYESLRIVTIGQYRSILLAHGLMDVEEHGT